MSGYDHRSAVSSRAARHLLASKLTAPPSAPYQVLRTALRDSICAADREKVVLVQAPAGYGKTTVLLQALAVLCEQGVATAWLTVDAADNDVARFLHVIGAALDRLAGPAEGDAGNADEAPAGVVALDLIERINRAPVPFALFIDDVEALQNPAALSLLRQLIEYLPSGGRVLVGSRLVPDIGAPRLLARGQLLQIDPAQLRFSEGETRDFLRGKRGLNLAASDIARLQGATEGWPVALWLASLALERREDAAGLVAHFSGSHAAVADYLAEEVLAQQSAELREFMMRTSVLGQLSAPLCDAVLGRTDSRELLDRLQRANLFVQPLGTDGEWFRYHSLFQVFLRTQLERSAPQDVPELHRAAAAWYETQRRPVPALEHALASGDAEYSLPLLARHAVHLLEEGRMRLLVRLLDSAPAYELSQWPELQLVHAWALSFTRGGHDAMRLLEKIEARATLGPQLQPHALALRPMLLTMLDRFDEAYAAALAAADRIGPEQVFPFSILRTSLANLHMVMGKYTAARELLDRSRAQQSASTGPFMMIFAQCVEGAIDLLHGRLRQATVRFRHSAGVGSRRNFTDTNGNAMAGILLAEVLYEQDELDEAERLLNVYVPLMQDLGMTDHLICGHRNLARIALYRGDYDRALHAVTEMEFFGHRMGLPRLVGSAQLERARLALTRGDVRTAREALQRARAVIDWSPVMARALFGNDTDTLVEGQLRAMIHGGAADEAVSQLKQELERAESARRHRRALKLRILLAMALDRSGSAKAALRMARDALRFGAAEHFLRVFLDEGELFQQLLYKLSAAQQREPDEPVGVAQLLERLTGSLQVVAPVAGAGAQEGAETLTRKELEILQLLAEGLSNLAIAERMFVSETTVRTHLRNINAKFQVHNRTQAIAVARRMKLLA